MIDFAKTQGEAAFLKKALGKFGLPSSVNEAIAALAGTIRDHKHLQRLVTETEPSMRTAFYESVRPHLKFQAKPMDVYIADAKQMADREQLPVIQQDGTLKAYSPPQDVATTEKAMAFAIAKRNLYLTCSVCEKNDVFFTVGTETPVAVVMKARRAGWVYDPVDKTETCPACIEAAIG